MPSAGTCRGGCASECHSVTSPQLTVLGTPGHSHALRCLRCLPATGGGGGAVRTAFLRVRGRCLSPCAAVVVSASSRHVVAVTSGSSLPVSSSGSSAWPLFGGWAASGRAAVSQGPSL